MRPTLVASTVLLSDNAILMGLRADSCLWECPGGKVESDGLVASWHRELKEETGLTTDETPRLCGVAEMIGVDQKPYCILFLFVRSWNGFPQRLEPEKCLAQQWFGFDELPDPKRCTPATAVFMRDYLPGLIHHIDKERRRKCAKRESASPKT